MALIRVYGHPRSGNNLLCAFLARNFYPGMKFTTRGRVGHWANRQQGQVNKYGKLAGTHLAFHDVKNKVVRPCVYIYRDGRDVCVSMWQTKEFQPPEVHGYSFSEFLRWRLDWCGSPGNPKGCNWPLPQHWRWHLDSWCRPGSEDVLKVRFEDLLANPQGVLNSISDFYGVQPAGGLKLVSDKVGWFPHAGRVGAWRDVFTADDLKFFYTYVRPRYWGLWEG